jgi:hypothetical protein
MRLIVFSGTLATTLHVAELDGAFRLLKHSSF